MTTFDKTINDDLSHDDDSCGFTADTRLIVKRCLLLVKRAAFLLAERKRRKSDCRRSLSCRSRRKKTG